MIDYATLVLSWRNIASPGTLILQSCYGARAPYDSRDALQTVVSWVMSSSVNLSSEVSSRKNERIYCCKIGLLWEGWDAGQPLTSNQLNSSQHFVFRSCDGRTAANMASDVDWALHSEQSDWWRKWDELLMFATCPMIILCIDFLFLNQTRRAETERHRETWINTT